MVAPARNPVIESLEDAPTSITLVVTGSYTATASIPFGVGKDVGQVEVVIFFTKVGAAPSVVFSLDCFDKASGQWVPMITSAAVVATSAAGVPTRLFLGPSAPATANVSANGIPHREMRVTCTHGNTDVCNYTIGVHGVDS